jgi:hypothetical protein
MNLAPPTFGQTLLTGNHLRRAYFSTCATVLDTAAAPHAKSTANRLRSESEQ